MADNASHHVAGRFVKHNSKQTRHLDVSRQINLVKH